MRRTQKEDDVVVEDVEDGEDDDDDDAEGFSSLPFIFSPVNRNAFV